MVIGCALSGLFLVGLAFLIFHIQRLFVNVADGFTLTAIVAIALLGVAVVACSLSRAWRAAPGCLAFAAAVTFAVLPWGVLSSPRDSAVAYLASIMKQAREDGRPIGTYGALVRNGSEFRFAFRPARDAVLRRDLSKCSRLGFSPPHLRANETGVNLL